VALAPSRLAASNFRKREGATKRPRRLGLRSDSCSPLPADFSGTPVPLVSTTRCSGSFGSSREQPGAVTYEEAHLVLPTAARGSNAHVVVTRRVR